MTLKKLLLFSFLEWAILALLKFGFISHVVFSNIGFQQLVFWLLVAVVITALVRRFGVINYLESFFLVIVWTLGNLLFDLLFVSGYTGLSLFFNKAYLGSYLVMVLAIVVFHKKRHVAIRRGEYHDPNHH